MRKQIVLIMAIACILLIAGCGDSNSAEDSTSTEGDEVYPAAIMVNDTVYLVEGNPMPTEVDESAIIGYIESHTGTFPENNGETNLDFELAIPYEVVFFELPEGEEDWALKIGAEVLITCSGGWTEPEPPHFGTLISITEMGKSDIDTDVLSPLD